jgi:hypothetical protein
VIWTHGRHELDRFISSLNQHHPNLRYTHCIQEKEVDCLDAKVHKGERFGQTGILDIKPYFKPTNKFQYTHFNSCHAPPKHI